MRISDGSSDVCSSDLQFAHQQVGVFLAALLLGDVDADAGQDRVIGLHVPVAMNGDPAHAAFGMLVAILGSIMRAARLPIAEPAPPSFAIVGQSESETCRERV